MTQLLIKVPGQTVDASDVTVPKNRKFREAWQLNGDVIDIDLPAARGIVRQTLRAERMTEFDKQDRKIFRLSRKVTRGGVLSTQEAAAFDAAEARAQKLRDAPTHPSIGAATSPAELEVITIDTVTK